MPDIEMVKLGLQLATFIIMVGGFIAGIWAFKKVTENHLAHMDMDLKEIIGSVNKNTENIGVLTASVAYLKGFLDKKEK